MRSIHRNMTLRAFAIAVAKKLKKSGIDVVLTGGTVVSIYSRNKYQSNDVDFLSSTEHKKIKEVMHWMLELI